MSRQFGPQGYGVGPSPEARAERLQLLPETLAAIQAAHPKCRLSTKVDMMMIAGKYTQICDVTVWQSHTVQAMQDVTELGNVTQRAVQRETIVACYRIRG